MRGESTKANADVLRNVDVAMALALAHGRLQRPEPLQSGDGGATALARGNRLPRLHQRRATRLVAHFSAEKARRSLEPAADGVEASDANRPAPAAGNGGRSAQLANAVPARHTDCRADHAHPGDREGLLREGREVASDGGHGGDLERRREEQLCRTMQELGENSSESRGAGMGQSTS